MKKLAFQDYQFALTQNLRAPKTVARPANTVPKRVSVYAELIYNNLNGFLESAFPVLRKILKKKRWKKLTRDFLRDHRSQSPLFRDIPQAFLDYLSTVDLQAAGIPPFALELAHYEWLELALDIHPQKVRWPKTVSLDMTQPVRVNPVLELVAYQFPVHQISPDNQPNTASGGPYFLLLWRNRHHRVGFKVLSAASAQLLHALQRGVSPIQAAVEILSGGQDHSHLEAILNEWLGEDVLVGKGK